jgi:hypothetical protein
VGNPTHPADPDPGPVFASLLAAITSIDLDHANLYTGLVLAVLPAAARDRLEEFMTTTGQRFYSEL